MSGFDKLLMAPIDWRDSRLAPVLADLQANILAGHGRDHSRNNFLRFDPAFAGSVRQRLAQLAGHITSASAQFAAGDAFRTAGVDGGPVILLALSATGYAAIGIDPPADDAFRAGMAAHAAKLSDPGVAHHEPHLRAPDALLLVAADSAPAAEQAAAALLAALAGPGIALLGVDEGLALRRPATAGGKGEGIEHFGYVDGRSQPLLLADKVAAEPASVWNPAFSPLDLALVRDPHAATDAGYGSYLVYRKLEQDVRSFKEQEAQLAVALGLAGADRDRAGAMVVGRFEDGTPLAVSPVAGAGPANDFGYADDADGLVCPFHAHIRKTNPRGDTVRRLGADDAAERLHLMPRRGIPYGVRADLPDLGGPFPSNGVGLLFMAYNRDIARQFEFTQKSWSNNPAFVDDALSGAAHTGVDPVTSPAVLLPGPGEQSWRATPTAPPLRLPFGGAVHMKGGDYFFAPAISAIAAFATSDA